MWRVGERRRADEDVRVIGLGAGGRVGPGRGTGGRIREHPGESRTVDPGGQRRRRLGVAPRTGDGRHADDRRRQAGAGGAVAGAIDAPHCDRDAGELRAGAGLSSRDDVQGIASAAALYLEGRALREKARLVGEGVQPALHQVRAEVVEQEVPAQQEERDDQERRKQADEDVGDHQLATDAPQQPALRGHQQADDEVRGADRQRHPGGGVDHPEKGRRGNDQQAEAVDDQPRHQADDDRAAGQRVQQCVSHALSTISRWRDCEAARSWSGHVRGLRDISRCIVGGS